MKKVVINTNDFINLWLCLAVQLAGLLYGIFGLIINNSSFQLSNCEYLQIFFVVCDHELNMFRFWTVNNLKASPGASGNRNGHFSS